MADARPSIYRLERIRRLTSASFAVLSVLFIFTHPSLTYSFLRVLRARSSSSRVFSPRERDRLACGPGESMVSHHSWAKTRHQDHAHPAIIHPITHPSTIVNLSAAGAPSSFWHPRFNIAWVLVFGSSTILILSSFIRTHAETPTTSTTMSTTRPCIAPC